MRPRNAAAKKIGMTLAGRSLHRVSFRGAQRGFSLSLTCRATRSGLGTPVESGRVFRDSGTAESTGPQKCRDFFRHPGNAGPENLLFPDP